MSWFTERFDWYGHGGILFRSWWQVVTSIVVLAAAVGVVDAKNDVQGLLDRQAKDDRARAAQVEQGQRARIQQCALTPIFVKALDVSKLTAEEERIFNASVQRNLKGCP